MKGAMQDGTSYVRIASLKLRIHTLLNNGGIRMKKLKKLSALLLILCCVFLLCSCSSDDAGGTAQEGTRTITDCAGREVTIPETVESIVCVNVGALRYTCYMQAQDLVVGVEDYEQEPTLARLYSWVNSDLFAELPIIGNNGEHYPEAIIEADPDVVILASLTLNGAEADELEKRTGIPVVVVPGSDLALDELAYDTVRLMGEVYGRQERTQELIAYFDSVKADLAERTAGIADSEKPSVYVAGVSFKGTHGFEGTEANYGPLALIGANNLADTTGQTGAFDIDTEQVLVWDPDYIFLDFNGMGLINADYADHPDFYNSLTAVKEGRVYSQISFRHCATNLETALADAYYAGSVIYPEQFADIDPEAKAAEIYEMLLGSDPTSELKEAGYEFKTLTLGA